MGAETLCFQHDPMHKDDLWLLLVGAIIVVAGLALTEVPRVQCFPLPGAHRCDGLANRYRDAFASAPGQMQRVQPQARRRTGNRKEQPVMPTKLQFD